MTKKAKDAPTPEDSGKKQALDLAISQITKQFGSGSIMKLGAPFYSFKVAAWRFIAPKPILDEYFSKIKHFSPLLHQDKIGPPLYHIAKSTATTSINAI